MFPEEDEVFIVNEPTPEDGQNVFDGKAFLYDYAVGDFVYRNGAPVLLEGKEALKAWIEKCLRTVKFKALVHEGLEYGPKIDDLIGSVFPQDFIKAEVEREVSEALLRNTYITGIERFDFEFEGDELTANIAVNTSYDESLEVAM